MEPTARPSLMMSSQVRKVSSRDSLCCFGLYAPSYRVEGGHAQPPCAWTQFVLRGRGRDRLVHHTNKWRCTGYVYRSSGVVLYIIGTIMEVQISPISLELYRFVPRPIARPSDKHRAFEKMTTISLVLFPHITIHTYCLPYRMRGRPDHVEF
jgi:hypothetical protein